MLSPCRRAPRALAGIFLVAWISAATPAVADQVVVQRHVTVREGPSRQTDRIIFPAIGSRLELLDEGRRSSGYYHVRLPDGRDGWIYHSFVRREADAVALQTLADLGPNRMAVHYIDVDQGAAALLEFECAAVMVDAGGRGVAAAAHLIAYLKSFFRRRPDLDNRLAALFVTHTHVDHNVSLKEVVSNFRVENYIHNGRLNGSGRTNAIWMADYAPLANPAIPVAVVTDIALSAAGSEGLTGPVIDPVNCAGQDPRIRILSGGFASNPGWSNTHYSNGNNHSLVIRVDFGESSFLFPGDLELKGIEHLIERYGATPQLDVDVYAVSHHGADNGTTAPLLAAMTPDIAVMSVGPSDIREEWTAWDHGHPRKIVVELLDAVIARRRGPTEVIQVATGPKAYEPYPMADAVHATSWDGDVVITADAEGNMVVSPSR